MKRSFDVVISAGALLILAPVLAVLAFVVVAAMGRPIFFRQLRPGLGGIPFELIKFRTMRITREGETGDAERLTAVGRFLRATSLDELPELWNVLVGQMSLVGPRPLLPEYLPLYSPDQARRHEVRPGLTGWAQVNGRNGLSWEEKFTLDVWYVDHWSFALDLAILWQTVVIVAARRGINDDTGVGQARFTGSGPLRPDP